VEGHSASLKYKISIILCGSILLSLKNDSYNNEYFFEQSLLVHLQNLPDFDIFSLWAGQLTGLWRIFFSFKYSMHASADENIFDSVW